MDNIKWLFFDIGSTLADESKVYEDIFRKIAEAACVYYPILEAIPVSDFVKGCFDSAIIFQ